MSSAVRILDIAPDQRPRERLTTQGASALSDAELLAILLGTGSKGLNALGLAQDLLVLWGGAAGLGRAEPIELARSLGVGNAKAARVVAALALGTRVGTSEERARLGTSADIAAIAAPLIGSARQEEVLVIVADGRSRVRHTEVVARGSAKHCVVPVRELLSAVLRHDGTTFGVAHNHPGGDAMPSAADIEATERLKGAAAEVGLRFLDHVVVTMNDWRSVSALS